jgi:hypothetical protein
MNTEVIFVLNHKPGFLHLPDIVRRHEGILGGQKVETATVATGGKSIPPSAPREKDGKPQPTAVDKAYWDAHCKNNKQVLSWMRKGWLSIAQAGEGEELEIDSLERLNLKTAITCVEGESNPRLLTEWLKTDSRAEVRDAITARLDSLKSNGKKDLPPLGGKR